MMTSPADMDANALLAAIFGPLDDAERTRVLETVIDRWVVLQEARRLSLFDASSDEVAAERAGLTSATAGFLAQWHARGWSDASLDECLARRLQAARYVDSRARFGPGRASTLPRKSGEAMTQEVAASGSVVAELRRRARVVVVGFAVGTRGLGRTSGRVSASDVLGDKR